MKNIDVEKFVEKFKTDILEHCNQPYNRRLFWLDMEYCIVLI